MTYAFRLNDRLVRYDHVTEYRQHEIGVYSYHTKGVLTWLTHIDGQTLGYYDSLGQALERAQAEIDRRIAALGQPPVDPFPKTQTENQN